MLQQKLTNEVADVRSTPLIAKGKGLKVNKTYHED